MMTQGLQLGSWRPLDLVAFALLAAATLFTNEETSASILGVTPEPDSWSDLAYPFVTGSFSAGTGTLTVDVPFPFDFPDLEIGSEYGPGDLVGHYGAGGEEGDSFEASIKIIGGTILPDGTASGTILVEFLADYDPGGIGIAFDYFLSPGDDLLVGTLTQAAIFGNTLDIEFEITGGALQTIINPAIGTNFSPGNLGMLRFGIAGGAPPTDFSGSFDVGSLDVFGVVPEPGCTTLAVFGLILAWVGGSRRCYSMHRVE